MQSLDAGGEFFSLLPGVGQLLLEVEVGLSDLVDPLILLTDQVLVLLQDAGVRGRLVVGTLMRSQMLKMFGSG